MRESDDIGIFRRLSARSGPDARFPHRLQRMRPALSSSRLRSLAMRCGAAAILFAATALIGPAAAQQPDARLWCEGKGGVSVDQRIGACTALISAGQETPQILAAAHSSRGEAYRTKGDIDRALQDYDQAIQLDSGNVIGSTKRRLIQSVK